MMKNLLLKAILFLIFVFSFSFNYAQNVAKPDTFCFEVGQIASFNASLNDSISPTLQKIYRLKGNFPCFRMLENGALSLIGKDECCGTRDLPYDITVNGQVVGSSTINVTVKCPKPECGMIELEPPKEPTAGQNGDGGKINYACQFSPTTYYTPYIPTNSYSWTPGPGGVISAGSNPAEVEVICSIVGNTTLTQIVNGVPTVYNINVLPAPTASFTMANNCVCNNSPFSFTNTSVGASSYYWDFGDGNNSTVTNPTHTYTNSGTYMVTLYAYSTNFDPRGNPLCCCVDTFKTSVIVDPKPGPNIYWISTLCEGDTSKYWTDATGCTFTWSVTNASNTPVTFTGQGNDTICVVWGSGPHGNITLQLGACSPAIYCEKPVTVQVPIISSVSQVTGDIKVCANSKEKYSIPKWNGTVYNWTVSGGMVVSGQGSHEVLIMWGSGPTGTINVSYHNPFLQGLPIHDQEDCRGTANLTVNIKPSWQLTNNKPRICKNDLTDIYPSPAGAYTYTITPSLTGWPITSVSGLSVPIANKGVYKICAYPVNANIYCNDTICTTVVVDSVGPVDSISGPMPACPNTPNYYTAHSSEPNVKFVWTVTGGTPSTFTGNPIAVNWTTLTTGTISVQQMKTTDPFCMSAPISKSVSIIRPKPLDSIGGNVNCVNAIGNYTAYSSMPQHASATYTWSVSPANKGSIYAGQGSPNVMIQWNNMSGLATIRVVVKVCGDSTFITKTVNINTPVIPNIVQIANVCNGVRGVLGLSPNPFQSAVWSSGIAGLMNTDTISVPGLYVVTTTDVNGCTAKDNITVNAIPNPIASISTGNLERICIPVGTPAPLVTYTALTNLNYSYQWYCNGNPQPPQTPAYQFVHTGTNVVGSSSYYVKITDMMTGCMMNSNIKVVTQDSCRDTCTMAPHSVSIVSSQSVPKCDSFNFGYTNTGATIIPVSWNFGTIYGSAGGTTSNPNFVYSYAGNYPVTLSYLVPNAWGTGYCTAAVASSVSVPVAPRFSHTITGLCRQVKFTNTTTTLPGVNVTSALWNFGDGSGPFPYPPNTMPVYNYAAPGTYLVSLTITTNTGCVSTYKAYVTVNGIAVPSYSVSPNPACVGDDILFTFLGNPADVLTFLYDFGDMSQNGGPNPHHTYLTANSFNTSLVVTDIYNCTSTFNTTVVVRPRPAKDTIAYTPKLKVCAGTNVTLTAPSGFGYTYLWTTGATSSSIVVNTSGTYGVVVTNSFGCSTKLDSVKVQVCPAPAAPIFGPKYICGTGSIDISTVSGMVSYQWYNKTSTAIGGATTNQLTVSTPISMDSFYVVVTDGNGCTNRSNWHKVTQATIPNVNILVVTGVPICAGSNNIFTANSTSPNISFQWSTGATSPTITATQVGTYTVIATDTITGCTGSANVIVNPLPDFCEMTTGCYEVCIPDTICGPTGMANYMWFYNGSMIPSSNIQCIAVTKAGGYSLKATNVFGCSATSDTLILETKICCDSNDTKITAAPATPGVDNCCYKLSYVNTLDSLMTMTIYTNNANLSFTAGSLHPSLAIIGTSPTSITVGSSTPGAQLPKTTLANFISICATNLVSSPVNVYINWEGPGGDDLCLDSIKLNCNPNECVYISKDSIRCNPQNGNYIYSVTVCNPITNNFTFGYINIIELLPIGIIVSPSAVNTSIAPGNCQTFNFTLSGTGLANSTFCFNLVAHEANPAEKPESKCCALDTMRCKFLPGCGPCDSVYVKSVTPTDKNSCCYKLTLSNYQNATAFNGIQLCALTTGTTITVNNTIGSGWTTIGTTTNTYTLAYTAGNIPISTFTLPEFCINNDAVPLNDIEIKWLGGIPRVTKCRDTVKVRCDIDCGYWEYKKPFCEGGKWIIPAIFHNNSDQIVYNASTSFIPNTTIANTTYNFIGGVLPGNSYGPINIMVNASLFPGEDTVCLITNLHNSLVDSAQTCCQFKTFIPVPPCGNDQNDCLCDAKFFKEVQKGLQCIFNGLKVNFSPIGTFTKCDRIIYEFNYPNGIAQVFDNVVGVSHTFPSPGIYEACFTIERLDVNGKKCKERICKKVKISKIIDFNISPNPASSDIVLHIDVEEGAKFEGKVSILDSRGMVMKVFNGITDTKGDMNLPIEELPAGIYLIRFETNDSDAVLHKKFIKIE